MSKEIENLKIAIKRIKNSAFTDISSQHALFSETLKTYQAPRQDKVHWTRFVKYQIHKSKKKIMKTWNYEYYIQKVH